ncbi:Phosphatase YbjI [Limosilactobacillus gastricus PS3]|uniref:Phosphatase YbjI n=1 Tax=Limosilactobacillus gastricus PS3 TaxID=1144300 RepID=H4GIC8_9LACO|nr:Cof-type HAD-IIB family hydrolase [Limosilactobacillus gastricus]EHS87349.1 Phosphatase YbjI [Limosilactobacillus gastricus PS3]
MIKAIAVDMDGTFLHSDGTYNHDRFLKVFRQLQDHQITLIAASGNPHYQLKKQFAPVQADLAYVAENGVEVIQAGQVLSCEQMTSSAIQNVFQLHQDLPNSQFILSGFNQAYLMGEKDDEFFDSVKHHYLGLKRIDDLQEVNEPIVKMQIKVPVDQTSQLQTYINDHIQGVTAVTSGYDDLDLIITGQDKAAGLAKLCQANHWQASELMAFGDGQNDLSMLNFVGHSYAMANGMAIVKEAAQNLAPSNDEDGVLQVIEAYLIQQYG